MVCEPRERLGTTTARLLTLSILLALASMVSAQVVTDLSPTALAVGETVTLRIVVDHEEPSDVTIDRVEIAGLRLVDGPSIRPITVAGAVERTRAVEISFRFTATTAGRFVVDPIPIDVAGQSYETDAKLVEIGEARDRSRVPFLCRWVVVDSELVAGQSTVVFLEMYNVRDYTYPSSVAVAVPTNAIFEEIQGVGTIAQDIVDGITLLAIPVAAFMLTPPGSGAVSIPAATVEADSMTVIAARVDITVNAAPIAIESSGAVGSFVLESEIDKTSLSVAETATFRLRVSGTGNLHFLRFPTVEVVGFEIESDRIEDSFEPVETGYAGYRERSMRLRPTAGGIAEVRVGPLVFFDPEREQIRRLSVDVPPIEVTTVKMPQSQESDELPFVLLDANQITAMQRSSAYRSPLSYGWLLPGLIVLLGRMLWKRQTSSLLLLVSFCGVFLVAAAGTRAKGGSTAVDGTSRLESLVASAQRYYDAEDLQAAIAITEDAARQFSDSPGVQYNLAVLYFHNGDLPRSAFAAREAIRTNPREPTFRRGLAIIEEGGGVEYSVAPKQVVHPGAFFAALAISINLLFVVLAVGWRRQRGAVVLAEIVLALAVVVSVTMVVVTARSMDAEVGVILADITLKRIPSDEAAGWRGIGVGTAVEIVAAHADHVLIRTAIGHEGWAPVADVLWHKNPDVEALRYTPADL